MSDVPSLDDFSEGIRYRRWDGTQRLDALEAEELLGAMSDELLAGGDLEDALARLSRWGIPGRMDGMKDLLERLRAAKQRRAERHDLSKVFDELKEKLDEVKRLEREGLERRRAAEAPDEQMRQAMQKLAQDRLAQLDALPQDFGRAMRALKDYEFVEPKAAEKYQELLKQLQEQVLGSYFKNMRDSLKNLTPEQLERTRDDPGSQPRAEGAHGGRRAGLRGVPATVPRARRKREGLGRSASPAGAGHGRDALAVAEHVGGHARSARADARRGVQRPGAAGGDERSRGDALAAHARRQLRPRPLGRRAAHARRGSRAHGRDESTVRHGGRRSRRPRRGRSSGPRRRAGGAPLGGQRAPVARPAAEDDRAARGG